MKNHWAILIGINQYECFQPLRYAQADAQGLRNLLVDEAGLSPDRCLLLTDTSPPLRGQSTYPNQENIQGWLEDLCHHHLQPGDVLWLFFSGYGITAEGKDYLMPIEGDPTRVTETGVSMKSLFEHVKAAPAESALVLLDMNRSQSSHWGGVTGNQTVELARKLEVTTILSCQLDGFSHETSDLKHGFFTTALLEGLRYGQHIKLETLNRYLTNRVPELSENHSRPEQQPLLVAYPSEKMHQIVFSYDNALSASAAETGAVLSTSTTADTDSDVAVESGTQDIESAAGSSSTAAEPNTSPAASISHVESAGNDAESPRRMRSLWSGVAVATAILVALVFWKHFEPLFGGGKAPAEPVSANSPEAVAGQDKGQGQDTGVSPKPDPVSQSPEVTASPGFTPAKGSPEGDRSQGTSQSGSQVGQTASSQDLLDQAQGAIRPTQASYYSQAISQAQKIRSDDPLYEKAQENIERWSLVIVDIAEGRAKQGDFVGAIAAAKLVPLDRDVAAKVKQSIGSWQQQAQQQRANRKLLQEAQRGIQRNQASTYSQAISIALKIPEGQPEYLRAQKLIAEWSQTIYNIAQSRANKGQLDAAVKAVELVPANTEAYVSAQRVMSQWRTKLDSR